MESLTKWVVEHAAEQGFLVMLLLCLVGFLAKYVTQLNAKIDRIETEFLRYIKEDHERAVELLEETKNALNNNTRMMEKFLESRMR
jgi:hypothetical protein